MARAEDSVFSPGLALPVGSLVVPTTLQILGLASLRAAGAVLGFVGLAGAVLLVLGPPVVVPAALGPHHLLLAPTLQFADQEQMLKEFVTRGLPSPLWSAPRPVAL
jgi:hypothetical protein